MLFTRYAVGFADIFSQFSRMMGVLKRCLCVSRRLPVSFLAVALLVLASVQSPTTDAQVSFLNGRVPGEDLLSLKWQEATRSVLYFGTFSQR